MEKTRGASLKSPMRNLIPFTTEPGQALCADPTVEPDWWFDDTDHRLAVSICERCPIAVTCLQYALDNNEPHGVWGGLTPDQRHLFKRKPQQLKG